MRKRWISDTIFDWPHYRGSSNTQARASVARAYEYWSHAERLLDGSPSPLVIADAVANLKRSLNQRLKLVEKSYHLRDLPLPGQRRGYLEILESLGVVRPALLRHLLDVRNAIEHKDARPPSARRCAELVDIVWYFLRSTDSLVRNVVSDLCYERTTADGYETQYGFTLELSYSRRPRFSISGWFPCEAIFDRQTKDATQIAVATIHTNAKWKAVGGHLDKLDSDLWIIASLLVTPPMVQRIIADAFDALS